jgi:hypothetical protein
MESATREFYDGPHSRGRAQDRALSLDIGRLSEKVAVLALIEKYGPGGAGALAAAVGGRRDSNIGSDKELTRELAKVLVAVAPSAPMLLSRRPPGPYFCGQLLARCSWWCSDH